MTKPANQARPALALVPSVDDPDAELVAQFRQGDQAAFTEIVRRHQQGLFKLAFRYLRSDADAQDVVQLAFVRAYGALAGFRGGSQLRTWLYRIAINLSINRTRDRKAARTESLDETNIDRAADVAAVDRPTGALAQLVSAEDSARVREAIGKLPERQRQVLELRVYHDLPFKEVAEIAECSENNAKVSFHHAVKRLRELLGSKS